MSFSAVSTFSVVLRNLVLMDMNEEIEQYLNKEMEQVPEPSLSPLPQHFSETTRCGNQNDLILHMTHPLKRKRRRFSKPTQLMTIFEGSEGDEDDTTISERVEVFELKSNDRWMAGSPQRGHCRSTNVLVGNPFDFI